MNAVSAAFACAAILYTPTLYASNDPMRFTIDMTGPSTDTFLVTIDVPKLGKNNNVYQFASTAPGAYQSVQDRKTKESTAHYVQSG
jgi:hypothetical protein